ncbi:MAG: hypothetical protein SGI92_30985 [Bryobacteraceae bacterium]|nr:hypothetical protein [Bryobacteraceae bacterium]
MQTTARGSLLLACVVAVAVAQAPSPAPPPLDPAPLYVESSIVNAASPAAGGLAPNTLATIYGQYLSDVTRSVTSDDIRAGVLPTVLPGTGVRVLIGGQPAPLLFVSPRQINFVVPSTILPGATEIRVGKASRYGPAVRVVLRDEAPALFLKDPEFAVATRGTELLTAETEASAGELLTLYATGLGVTNPRPEDGQIVRLAAPLVRTAEFRLELEGIEVPARDILYAGLAPGFAGLYQVNVRLPELRGRNPEIRMGFGNVMSPSGVRLHASPRQPGAATERPRLQLDLFQERYAPNSVFRHAYFAPGGLR